MDELLLIEPAQIAMPRAYWLGFEERVLSSQLLLVQPSIQEFDRVMNQIENGPNNAYDMDILTTLYQDSAMVLPHRPYDLLTGEFRGEDHQKYLQDHQQEWDPDAVLKEAKYMHFSDWPLPKVCRNESPSNTFLHSLLFSLGWPDLTKSTRANRLAAQRPPATRQTTVVINRYGLEHTRSFGGGEK